MLFLSDLIKSTKIFELPDNSNFFNIIFNNEETHIAAISVIAQNDKDDVVILSLRIWHL